MTCQFHASFLKAVPNSLKVCACVCGRWCGARRVSVSVGGRWHPQQRSATLPVLPRPAPRTLFWSARFSRLVCVGAAEGRVCSLAARGDFARGLAANDARQPGTAAATSAPSARCARDTASTHAAWPGAGAAARAWRKMTVHKQGGNPAFNYACRRLRRILHKPIAG